MQQLYTFFVSAQPGVLYTRYSTLYSSLYSSPQRVRFLARENFPHALRVLSVQFYKLQVNCDVHLSITLL